MNHFAVNREVLLRWFPQLGRELFEGQAPSDQLELFPSKTGLPTGILRGKAFCSRQDPVREGQKLADGEIPPGTGCCVFTGFGLGYVVEAFLSREPDNLAIIAEKDPGIFLKALESRDLTAVLSSGRIWFLFNKPPDHILEALKRAGTRKVAHFVSRYVRDTEPDWCRGMENQVAQFINRRNVNINTLKKFGRRWILNFGANLRRYRDAIDLEQVKGIFTGIPCLLLAAGPSLEDILPHLSELRKRFLLVSVDTALRSLLRLGIIPDITVVVDPQYWNFRHLDRCQASGSLLITDSAAFPDVFTRFHPPWVFYRSPFPLAGFMEKGFGFRGKLRGGGSVATAAWEISRMLGCSGVWAAGLDLGFPGGQTHYKGSFFEELRHVISGRFRTEELLQWHALKDALPHHAENTSGGRVLTDQRMKIYRLWFEEQSERYPEYRTVNLSSGGVKIAGHHTGTVDTLLNRPVIRNQIDDILTAVKKLPPGGNFDAACLPALMEISCFIREIAGLASEGLGIVRNLFEELPGGQLDPGKLKALDHIDQALIGCPGKEIVSFILQPLIYRISWSDDRPTGAEEILRETEEIYQAIADSAEFHRKILEKAEKHLKIPADCRFLNCGNHFLKPQ